MRIFIMFFIFTLFSNAVILNKTSFDTSKKYTHERQVYTSVINGESWFNETFFYPIGWSKNGKFAYIKRLPAGDADNDSLIFYIQDMVTDKILVESDLTKHLLLSNIQYIDLDNMNILHLLSKYKIQHQDFKLKQFPIQTIYAKLIKFRDFKSEYFGKKHKFLTYLKIRIENSKTGKSKIIYHKRYGKQNADFDAVITGYISSPFEHRVAIILSTFQRGWEGAVHTGTITLIGASTTKGM